MQKIVYFLFTSLVMGLPMPDVHAAAQAQNQVDAKQWSMLRKIKLKNSQDRNETFELSPNLKRMLHIVYQNHPDLHDWGQFKLSFFDIASGRLLHEIPWQEIPCSNNRDFFNVLRVGWEEAALWSPDENYVLMVDVHHTNQVRVVDVRTGAQRVLSLENHAFCPLIRQEWDTKSRYVAINIVEPDYAIDRSVRYQYVFDVRTGRRVHRIKNGAFGDWSPSGRYVIFVDVSCGEGQPEETRWAVYEVREERWQRVATFAKDIKTATWLDDDHIVWMDMTGNVHKTTVQQLQRQARLSEIDGLLDDKISVDRFPQGILSIIADYDAAEYELFKSNDGLQIQQITCSHQGKFIACEQQAWVEEGVERIELPKGPMTVEVRDAATGQVVFEKTYKDNVRVNAIAFSEDDTLLLVNVDYCRGQLCHITGHRYDLQNHGAEVFVGDQVNLSTRKRLSLSLHPNKVLRWSSDGKRVAINHKTHLTIFENNDGQQRAAVVPPVGAWELPSVSAPAPARGNRFWSFLRKPKVYGLLLFALALAVGGGGYYRWWKKHRLPLVV